MQPSRRLLAAACVLVAISGLFVLIVGTPFSVVEDADDASHTGIGFHPNPLGAMVVAAAALIASGTFIKHRIGLLVEVGGIAILFGLGWLGKFGTLVWYMPVAALLMGLLILVETGRPQQRPGDPAK